MLCKGNLESFLPYVFHADLSKRLSTACDLEARICNSADLILFYHPVFAELGLGGESKGTYFVDWGQASVNSRLEDRMLARQETPSHVFVQYPGVKVCGCLFDGSRSLLASRSDGFITARTHWRS